MSRDQSASTLFKPEDDEAKPSLTASSPGRYKVNGPLVRVSAGSRLHGSPRPATAGYCGAKNHGWNVNFEGPQCQTENAVKRWVVSSRAA